MNSSIGSTNPVLVSYYKISIMTLYLGGGVSLQHKASTVIVYGISKCSLEKMCRRSRAMCDIHHQLLDWKSSKKKNISYQCKILLVDFVIF